MYSYFNSNSKVNTLLLSRTESLAFDTVISSVRVEESNNSLDKLNNDAYNSFLHHKI